MPEELLRQILEQLRSQDDPAWLDALKLVMPAITGIAGALIVAMVSFYAVKRGADAQLRSIGEMATAQQRLQAGERRAAWRRERYQELLAALGEFLGALRSLNLSLGILLSSFAPGQDPLYRELYRQEFFAASNRVRQINLSSRLFEAAVKVADKETADLAQGIGATLLQASTRAVAVGSSPQFQNDEKRLREESEALNALQQETSQRIYDLNVRIEKLISEAG